MWLRPHLAVARLPEVFKGAREECGVFKFAGPTRSLEERSLGDRKFVIHQRFLMRTGPASVVL
jgi:hypothetical protein